MIKRKLEKIVNSNIFYIILFVIALIYFLLNSLIERKSIYNLNDTIFTGILKKVTISDSKVSFTIDNKEPLLCNFYFKEGTENIDYITNFPLGSEVKITGTLNQPLNNTIPNTFNYKKYLFNHDTFYTCNLEDIKIINKKTSIFYIIKNFIIKRIMSFKVKDYLYTMIIGDKSLLDEETFDNYQKNGVTHLFAISGMHVGLFSVFFLKLFKKLKPKKKYLLVTTFIWFYAFLAGFTPSITRACLLFSLISFFKIINIKIDTIRVLLITGFLLIMQNYQIVKDIGFLYSFTTTFGLIYSKNILSNHKIMGTSLVATLYSLPITICNFYKFNLLSPLINIIFVPLVSVIIYPLCLLTFFFKFLEPLTELGINILEFLNRICANIDFLNIVVPKMNLFVLIFYYIFLTIFFKNKIYIKTIILTCLILITKLKPLLDNSYYVEFLDVGQGDSTLIRTPQSKEVILIDTGGKDDYNNKSNYHVASNTITYLNSLGINKIDYAILTHGDTDHLGDTLYLKNNIHLKNVILNKGELNQKEIDIIKSGINIKNKYEGKLKLKFLNDKIWSDENSNSIVTYLNILNNHFLLMGDATKEVEKYIISNHQIDKVDILKLGHHGSKTSSDKNFLEKIKVPKAIISAGRNNRYKHPNIETINTLKQLNIDYLSTQIDGTISFTINKHGITQKTFPP